MRINKTQNFTAAFMSEHMERDKGQLARLIKEMINKELIQKSPNPDDTRSQLLSLTNNGKTVLERTLAIESKLIQKMLRSLCAEQIKVFNEVATIMTENLSKRDS